MDLSFLQIASVVAVVTFAYVVFGIASFGAGLIAVPILAHFLPITQIVPMLALLDFSAAVTNIMRDRKQADLVEFKRLMPLIIAGSIVGAVILLNTRPDLLLLLLGLFAVGYSVYALSGTKPRRRFSAALAWPFGFIGGVLSALFGTGGFLYAIYLAGRIEAKDGIRGTQATLIGVSTLSRVVLFLIAGVYAEWRILVIAALLFPAMFIGVRIGRRITLRLSREQFIAILNVVVLASGIALLARYFF